MSEFAQPRTIRKAIARTRAHIQLLRDGHSPFKRYDHANPYLNEERERLEKLELILLLTESRK